MSRFYQVHELGHFLDHLDTSDSRNKHVMSIEETRQQFQERYEQVIAMLMQAGAKTQDEIDAEAQAKRVRHK